MSGIFFPGSSQEVVFNLMITFVTFKIASEAGSEWGFKNRGALITGIERVVEKYRKIERDKLQLERDIRAEGYDALILEHRLQFHRLTLTLDIAQLRSSYQNPLSFELDSS